MPAGSRQRLWFFAPLDAEAFKNILHDVLLPELKAGGRTVIVISHDDVHVGSADRIIELGEGAIRAGRGQRPELAAAH